MSKKLFIKGTLLLTFAGLLSRLMGFFYRIFLSHTIGAHGLGIFQLVLPLQLLIMSICASGIQTAISRLTAAEKVSENSRYHTADYFVIGTIFSVAFSLVFSWFLYRHADFWAVQILKEPQTSGLIRILSLSIPLSTLHTCVNSYYFGRKQAGFPAGVQLLEQLFRTGGCYLLYLICVSQGQNITPAIAVGGNLIGETASAFISVFAVSMHFKVTHYTVRNIRTPLSILRELLHLSVPLTMNKILLTLLGSVEVILIPARLQMSGLTPKDSLSVYGVFTGMALPLILFPATLTNSAATMLLPSITQLQVLGYQKQIQYVIGRIFRYCLLLGGFCMVIFLFLGEFLGNFLFHSQTAGIYIHTMSYICPFLYLNTTLSSVLNGLGKPGFCLIHSVISVCIRIFFVLFVIPVLGVRGYLYGILCSELVLCILHSFRVLQSHPKIF
nr:polysaccharide biosynthesis protein [uncultured Blautia sp.]